MKPTPKSSFQAEEAGVPTHEVICRRYGEGRACFQQTDVTSGAEVKALVSKAAAVGGKLDVIANNAGIGGTENHGQIYEMTEETWDTVMSINSRNVFLGCKYACAQFL